MSYLETGGEFSIEITWNLSNSSKVGRSRWQEENVYHNIIKLFTDMMGAVEFALGYLGVPPRYCTCYNRGFLISD